MGSESQSIEEPKVEAFSGPRPLRAWFNLIRISWQRQARAHLLVWIALGLLVLTVLIVLVNTHLERWNTSYWRSPRGRGPSYADFLFRVEAIGYLPLGPASHAVHHAVWGSLRQVIFESSGFFVFSNGVVFTMYATFLLPLWCLCFATEGLGREREARNLIWLLTRPLPRWAMYLAKFVALLPWALLLSLGGFALICAAAPVPGRLAVQLYWPAILWGTLAFCAVFHLMGAVSRRPAVLAILYSFFLETIMGNMPGHMKRLSLSFYTRCLMFDSAEEFGIRPARPHIYLPVSGPVALSVLIAVTLLALAAGMYLFSRREYLDVSG